MENRGEYLKGGEGGGWRAVTRRAKLVLAKVSESRPKLRSICKIHSTRVDVVEKGPM